MTYPSTEQSMTLTLERPADDTAVLRVVGEVDMLTSPDFREAITEQLAARRQRLMIELDGVDFLGTSGLAVLVEARERAANSSVDLWLVCTTRNVLRPLEIAGLTDLFHITDSVPAGAAGTRPE
ncbi:MAG TPA: STAS domain-containing protein [Pseudonocardia sp.]